MSNLLKSKFLMGVMVVAVMVVGFAAVSVDSASADCSITMTLKVGSTGSEVSCLQAKVGATADGKFGPMTKVSVMAWQSGHGLSADGVVGALTRAALNGAMMGGSYPAGCTSASGYSMTTGMSCSSSMSYPAGCSSTSGYSPTTGAKCDSSSTSTSTGPLAGTDGAISDVNELSQYNNEEVGEGSNDVKVVGFEVEASTDGDISLRSVKLSATITNASGSNNFDDYVDSVTVWQGSTKVGSADAGDFSEDTSGVWTKTVTLSNAVVRADKTEKFYVSFDAVSNLDSGDIDSEVFTVDVENLRFEDGSGVVTTESSGELDGMDVPVNFVSFSTAADTELKVSTDSSTPDAGIVIIDTSDNTDGVVLLKGKFKLEGDSDVNIDALPVTLTLGGATNIDAVANSLTLVLDGNEYTESLGSNCDPVCSGANSSATVTFDNLDFDMSAGDTVNFEIRADINDIETGIFNEGDSLTASVTSSQVDSNIDVENSEGDQLTTSETSGSATGKTQEFRSQGITLTLLSTNAVKSASDTNDADTATFTLKFKVTAVGDDVYVATTAGTSGGAKNLYSAYKSSTATTAGVSEAIVNTTDTDLTASGAATGGNWLIEDGSSETITLTVLKSITANGNDGLYKAALTAIKWNTTDSSSTYNSYTSNLEEFVTDYVDLD